MRSCHVLSETRDTNFLYQLRNLSRFVPTFVLLDQSNLLDIKRDRHFVMGILPTSEFLAFIVMHLPLIFKLLPRLCSTEGESDVKCVVIYPITDIHLLLKSPQKHLHRRNLYPRQCITLLVHKQSTLWSKPFLM